MHGATIKIRKLTCKYTKEGKFLHRKYDIKNCLIFSYYDDVNLVNVFLILVQNYAWSIMLFWEHIMTDIGFSIDLQQFLIA
jgi:hypothetical protein